MTLYTTPQGGDRQLRSFLFFLHAWLAVVGFFFHWWTVCRWRWIMSTRRCDNGETNRSRLTFLFCLGGCVKTCPSFFCAFFTKIRVYSVYYVCRVCHVSNVYCVYCVYYVQRVFNVYCVYSVYNVHTIHTENTNC